VYLSVVEDVGKVVDDAHDEVLVLGDHLERLHHVPDRQRSETEQPRRNSASASGSERERGRREVRGVGHGVVEELVEDGGQVVRRERAQTVQRSVHRLLALDAGHPESQSTAMTLTRTLTLALAFARTPLTLH
jgi:hypothetical protein